MTFDIQKIQQDPINGNPFSEDFFPNKQQVASSFQYIVEALSLKDHQLLTDLREKIIHSAEPQMALNNFQRFVESYPEKCELADALIKSEKNVNVIVVLMAGSQFLSDVLINQSEAFPWLISNDTLHGRRIPDYYRLGAAATVNGIDDRAQQCMALSRWKRREYLRIGCRDLLGVDNAEDVSRDISDLAEAIIDQAAILVYAELSARFGNPGLEASTWQENIDEEINDPDSQSCPVTGMCVLGMGKLGGRELNFSSDIDLVFIYEDEGETTGRLEGSRRVAVISNHDFFTRMGEGLVRFLGERGPAGNLFRVDMRLRPEGVDGPLVRSLDSYNHYLNTQGRDWERLAYLKARVVSGPPSLAEKLYRMMGEFVFSGDDPRRIVNEVQSLKLRIDREVINSDLYKREVKRGYGGIREIEFVITTMQILHGAHHHALRIRNTFLAIQRLLETQLLSEEAAEFYQVAYSFLRTVEHRLQMEQEAQTHTLPLPGPEFEAVARRCGFNNGEDFQLEYERITNAVHERFTEFFKHDTNAMEQAVKDTLVILDRSAPSDEALLALERRGFSDNDILRLIHSLAYGTREVFVSAEGQRSFEQMLPALLRLAASAPFPERVFSQLHSFALAMKGITYYYEVIAHHPEILSLLVTLFGTSEELSSQLIAYPEFFDSLISTRILNEVDTDGKARRERMHGVFSIRTPARRLQILRRVVHFERLVYALRYLLHIEPLEECLNELSDTADVALQIAARLACARVISKKKDIERPDEDEVDLLTQAMSQNMCIIALGKYGGHELNFYGDLDVVFTFDDNQAIPEIARDWFDTPQKFYDTISDAITSVLSEQLKGGRAFVIDARLRPHGNSAAFTVPSSAYASYLEFTAETWELQAFHRARAAWGNNDICKNLHQAAQTAAGKKSNSDLINDISTMRLRLEETVSKTDDEIEVKRSAGGIVDVEFLLQYLVLKGDIPWNEKSTNYFQALRHECPAIIGKQESSVLLAGYSVLRGVENTMRLITGGSSSALSISSPNVAGLARTLGFKNPELLVEQVNDIKREIRAVYSQHLSADPGDS